MNFTSTVPSYKLSSVAPTPGGGSIDSTLAGEFGVSMENGLLFPVPSRPTLVANKPTPFRIEKVETDQEDPVNFHFSNNPSDTTFQAIQPDDDLMLNANILTDRHCLRKILTAVSPPVPNAVLCKKNAFTILVEKIGGKVVLQKYNQLQDGAATWDVIPGGYGEGFENAMVIPNEEIKDMFYYRIAAYSLGGLNLLVRHEVDCLDAQGREVELKSNKCKKDRYGNFYKLGQDFYLNLWTQMALADTKTVRIGRHTDGLVEQLITMSLSQVAQNAGVTEAYSTTYFKRMANVLRWMQQHLPEGAQGLVEHSGEGSDHLTMRLLAESDRLPCISDETRAKFA